MIRTVIIYALIASSCAGCGSGIFVKRFDGTASTMKGVPYNLPMTTFTITITRRVIGCGERLKGSVEVQVISSKALDPAGMFTLYADGWFSTSAIKSTFAPDGTSTALNSSSENTTAAVISNVVSAVAAITPLLAAAGAVPTAKAEACTDKVKAAVNEIKKLKDTVDRETNDLAAATDQVTLLSSQVAVLGNAADKSIKKALVAALGTQAKAKKKLADDQKKLAEDMKLISNTQPLSWPDNGSVLSGGPYSIDVKNVLNKWATISQPEKAAKEFDVYLQLERTGSLGIDGAKLKTAPQIDISQGVPIRFAVPGRLKVCALAACGAPDAKVIGKFEGPIMQLGLVYTVPANGGLFKSEAMSLATDTNGAPSAIEVTEKVAATAAATGVLKDMTTQVGGIPSAINTAKLAKIKAQTDQLTAENALETAKANNADAEVLAPIQAETALAQAKLAQINADAALQSAQKMQSAAGN